jgi:hypothetical protein
MTPQYQHETRDVPRSENEYVEYAWPHTGDEEMMLTTARISKYASKECVSRMRIYAGQFLI